MTREMELNTVIFEGDYNSMKTAFSRSILGVTYKKFKRKGNAFFVHKTHNEISTREMIKKLYFELKEFFGDLENYKIKVNYYLVWNDNGKIIAFKNVKINTYISLGELIISDLKINDDIKPIKIELFYSDIDVSSKYVKKLLEELKLLNNSIIYHEYNILNDNGKEEAVIRGIELVPTVIIHDEIKLENPDKSDIEEAIKKLSEPKIITNGVKFAYENSIENNVSVLNRKFSKQY